jgi:hypothetical protein
MFSSTTHPSVTRRYRLAGFTQRFDGFVSQRRNELDFDLQSILALNRKAN